MNKQKAIDILMEQQASFLIGVDKPPYSDYEKWCIEKAGELEEVINWIKKALDGPAAGTTQKEEKE